MYKNDGLLLFEEDFGDVAFYFNEMGILSVILHNVNFNHNFDEDDPDAILIGLLPWHSKFKTHKMLKKDKRRIDANSVAS